MKVFIDTQYNIGTTLFILYFVVTFGGLSTREKEPSSDYRIPCDSFMKQISSRKEIEKEGQGKAKASEKISDFKGSL